MKSCTQYKDLIDRHFELEEVLRNDLSAHLASCDDCSAYKAEADKTLRVFRELRSYVGTGERPDRAFETLARNLASRRRQMFWALTFIAACVVAPIVIAARGGLTVIGGLFFLLAGAMSCAFAWWLSRDRLATLPLKQMSGEFYKDWRFDLERRIRLTTIVAVAVAIEVVVLLLVLALLDIPFFSERGLVFAGLAFVLGAGVLYTIVVELRHLKNELALIQEADRA